jgi:hypothetical protein
VSRARKNAARVERLDLEGALVSIDAIGCDPNIAQPILDAKADYLLAVKDNQPTLKDHGRFERNHSVSQVVNWYAAQRRQQGVDRPPGQRAVLQQRTCDALNLVAVTAHQGAGHATQPDLTAGPLRRARVGIKRGH